MNSKIDFELDHIGIAVKDLKSSLDFYKALGIKDFHIEEVPSEKVRVGFVPTKNGADLELLEPTDESSVISKFLTKRGEGIHHICFGVEDIESVLAQLSKNGVTLIDSKPRIGAGGCRVAFIHPKSANGVLVELSEKPKD